MINHTYNGETVKVKKGNPAEMDSYAREILAARDTRQNPNASEHWEVDRMPADVLASDAPKRPRGRPKGSRNAPKVIDHPKGESPAEGHTVPAESTLYAQGFYRVPCATCGEGIKRTGKKGRAPKFHSTCIDATNN